MHGWTTAGLMQLLTQAHNCDNKIIKNFLRRVVSGPVSK